MHVTTPKCNQKVVRIHPLSRQKKSCLVFPSAPLSSKTHTLHKSHAHKILSYALHYHSTVLDSYKPSMAYKHAPNSGPSHHHSSTTHAHCAIGIPKPNIPMKSTWDILGSHNFAHVLQTFKMLSLGHGCGACACTALRDPYSPKRLLYWRQGTPLPVADANGSGAPPCTWLERTCWRPGLTWNASIPA